MTLGITCVCLLLECPGQFSMHHFHLMGNAAVLNQVTYIHPQSIFQTSFQIRICLTKVVQFSKRIVFFCSISQGNPLLLSYKTLEKNKCVSLVIWHDCMRYYVTWRVSYCFSFRILSKVIYNKLYFIIIVTEKIS